MSAIKPAAGIHLSGLGNRFLLAVQQNLIAVRSIPRSILTNGFEVQILKIPPLGSSEGMYLLFFFSFSYNPSPLLHHGFACFRWSWQKNLRISENEAHGIDSQVKREKTHTHTINRLILKAEIDCSSADRSKALQSHGERTVEFTFSWMCPEKRLMARRVVYD